VRAYSESDNLSRVSVESGKSIGKALLDSYRNVKRQVKIVRSASNRH